MKRGFIFLIVALTFIISVNLISASVILSDQGSNVTDKSTNKLVSNGNLTVTIWDSATGGSPIYNETFVDAIQNGQWDVSLGSNVSNPLNLIFNHLYYKDYAINGQDLNFTNSTGSEVDRQAFYSPIGEINTTSNITANYGFFNFLGSLSNPLQYIFADVLNVSGPIYSEGHNLTNGVISIENATYYLTSNPYGYYNSTTLSNPVTGTGSSGYLPKYTGGTTVGNSVIYQSGSNIGIRTTGPSSSLSVGGAGVSGAAISGIAGTYGVYGEGNWGVDGYSNASNGAGIIAGVTGTGTGGHGIIASALGSSGGGCGILNSFVGVEACGANYDFYANGPGTDYGSSSSIRWKDNITAINPQLALNKTLELQGDYFNWKIYNQSHDMGFIAEQVGPIVPEVVQYDDPNNASNWYTLPNGSKALYAIGVDYGKLTPLLVQAIKGQEEIINNLNLTVQEQNQTINQLKTELCSKDNTYSWC